MCVFHNCQVAKDLVDGCPCFLALNVLHFELSLIKGGFFIKKNLKRRNVFVIMPCLALTTTSYFWMKTFNSVVLSTSTLIRVVADNRHGSWGKSKLRPLFIFQEDSKRLLWALEFEEVDLPRKKYYHITEIFLYDATFSHQQL